MPPAITQPAPAFLALGDSYTIGEKVAADDRWPMQLARMLRAAGVPVADPRIIARTGWTTDELDAGITAVGVTGSHALVTLLIGVNNQYRGRNADEYRAQFRSLLARAIGFAGGSPARVVVLSIPDWGVMPFAEGRDRGKVGREIDAFNAIAKDEAAKAGAAWVDVTPVSRAMRDGWAASDGLHPSGAQYAEWAALAFAPARAALGVK
jgi:lysophospholipase L1-like esterase